MTRQRSPNYPNLSLPDALARVRKVFDQDRQAPLDRAVVAKHMGYAGISGAADKTIGSIMQYGLLERVAKGEIRVSQLAVNIFHPLEIKQKREALHAAGYAPEVFRLLRDRFGLGKVPSEDAAKSYLVRMEFLDRAIDPIISAYAETCQFLEREGANETVGPSAPQPEESPGEEPEMTEEENLAVRLGRARERVLNAERRIAEQGFTQRVLTKGMLSKGSTFEIIVSGHIGPKEIDTLIRKLEIDKELLSDEAEGDT